MNSHNMCLCGENKRSVDYFVWSHDCVLYRGNFVLISLILDMKI